MSPSGTSQCTPQRSDHCGSSAHRDPVHQIFFKGSFHTASAMSGRLRPSALGYPFAMSFRLKPSKKSVQRFSASTIVTVREAVPVSKRAWFWIAFNLIAIAYFLFCSSRLWSDVNLPGPGDGFYWLIFIAPVLLLCLIINLVALAHIVTSRKRVLRLRSVVWTAIACLWIAAVVGDARMGTPCDTNVCLHS